MEKVIRNGKVAVLYSPGFGAGWYTWNTEHKELLFHPKVVAMVEAGRKSEIDSDWILQELGLHNIYCGGAEDLEIKWLNEGEAFAVNEYDGAESIASIDSLSITA